MQKLKESFRTIVKTQPGILAMMIILLITSIILLIVSLVQLNPAEIATSVGYGDIGGYRTGSWLEMLAFPVLAIIFGLFHNIIAVRLYKKRGADSTKAFLGISLMLVLFAGIVLLRVVGA